MEGKRNLKKSCFSPRWAPEFASGLGEAASQSRFSFVVFVVLFVFPISLKKKKKKKEFIAAEAPGWVIPAVGTWDVTLVVFNLSGVCFLSIKRPIFPLLQGQSCPL